MGTCWFDKVKGFFQEPHAGFLPAVAGEQVHPYSGYLEPAVGSQVQHHARIQSQPYTGYHEPAYGTQGRPHAIYREPTVWTGGQTHSGYLEPAVVRHVQPHAGYLQPAVVRHDGQGSSGSAYVAGNVCNLTLNNPSPHQKGEKKYTKNIRRMEPNITRKGNKKRNVGTANLYKIYHLCKISLTKFLYNSYSYNVSREDVK